MDITPKHTSSADQATPRNDSLIYSASENDPISFRLSLPLSDNSVSVFSRNIAARYQRISIESVRPSDLSEAPSPLIWSLKASISKALSPLSPMDVITPTSMRDDAEVTEFSAISEKFEKRGKKESAPPPPEGSPI